VRDAVILVPGLEVYPDSSVLFGSCVPVTIFDGYGLEVGKEGRKILDRFRLMCSCNRSPHLLKELGQSLPESVFG
jgi:hypothetical protein